MSQVLITFRFNYGILKNRLQTVLLDSTSSDEWQLKGLGRKTPPFNDHGVYVPMPHSVIALSLFTEEFALRWKISQSHTASGFSMNTSKDKDPPAMPPEAQVCYAYILTMEVQLARCEIGTV